MPKHLAFESIRHHLLRAIERRRTTVAPADARALAAAAASLAVRRGIGPDEVVAGWSAPAAAEVSFPRHCFVLYRRGDLPRVESGLDPYDANVRAADAIVTEMLGRLTCTSPAAVPARIEAESKFHDEWAYGVEPDAVHVREAFELPTAPENRFIVSALGDLRGKQVLDLGSGLGEAAVYFALQGARVTACDVSPAMLDLVQRVARRHGVNVAVQEAPAEDTGLPAGEFDIVYAGNVLHHVDTPRALAEISRILKPGGVLASWDPLAHNPVINVYRRLATAVRTADEHPLRMEELQLFSQSFRQVSFRCFWLTSQAVFLKFFFVDRVHPSKDRYWKRILSRYDSIKSMYSVLSRLDEMVLRTFPWLRRYCWNVVVLARK